MDDQVTADVVDALEDIEYCVCYQCTKPFSRPVRLGLFRGTRLKPGSGACQGCQDSDIYIAFAQAMGTKAAQACADSIAKMIDQQILESIMKDSLPVSYVRRIKERELSDEVLAVDWNMFEK